MIQTHILLSTHKYRYTSDSSTDTYWNQVSNFFTTMAGAGTTDHEWVCRFPIYHHGESSRRVEPLCRIRAPFHSPNRPCTLARRTKSTVA